MFQSIPPIRGNIDLDILLAWGGTFKRIDKGELIFSEGTQCNYYHQLVSGCVRWVNIDEEGKMYVQSFIEPGEAFGEMPLFDDGPFASSAYAEADSLVIRLRKETFLRLMESNSSLLMDMTRLLAKRLRFKFFLIKCMANPSPEFRISRLLEHFTHERRHLMAETNQLLLTRQQLAELSGLRVETVIRAVRHLHEKGMLLIQDRKIFL